MTFCSSVLLKWLSYQGSGWMIETGCDLGKCAKVDLATCLPLWVSYWDLSSLKLIVCLRDSITRGHCLSIIDWTARINLQAIEKRGLQTNSLEAGMKWFLSIDWGGDWIPARNCGVEFEASRIVKRSDGSWTLPMELKGQVNLSIACRDLWSRKHRDWMAMALTSLKW
jgi:hypothetical protein